MKNLFFNLTLLLILSFLFTGCGSNGPEYDFVEVQYGDLNQVVSATGFLQPQERVNLAMEVGGKISEVLVDVGDKVEAGDVLVRLRSADVATQLQQAEAGISSSVAQVEQAQANLERQEALLDDLLKGSSEENIKVAEIAVSNAEQALVDLEKELSSTKELNEDSLNSVYDSAVSSLEKSLTTAKNSLYFLTNLQYQYFPSSDFQSLKILDSKAEIVLLLLGKKDAGRWNNQSLDDLCEGLCADIEMLRQDGTQEDIDLALDKMLTVWEEFKIVYNNVPMDGTLNTTDKTQVNAEKTSVDLEITSLSATKQNINLQKTTNEKAIVSLESRYNTAENQLESAEANLDLVKSKASDSQVAAQEATVKQTQASVKIQQALLQQSRASYNSLLVNLDKYDLEAPFAGIVTEQLAKRGESVAPQKAILSLMSENNFQIEASIRETDIDKIEIGDLVTMYFDALPQEEFTGKLVFIDPAENVQQGVIYYDVKIIVDENENTSRLKSGMTADLDIVTDTQEDILYLPMGVITYRGGKAYVSLLKDEEVVEEEIQTGIESSGYIEIYNSLQAGDKVISSFIE